MRKSKRKPRKETIEEPQNDSGREARGNSNNEPKKKPNKERKQNLGSTTAKRPSQNPRDFSHLPVHEALQEELQRTSLSCINCTLCQKECAFLQKYGKPKEIADAYDPKDKAHLKMPFACSLCELCKAVCPAGVNPSLLFLRMREETMRRFDGAYSKHRSLLAYERRGISKRYSYYALPDGCHTVFFPGCSLPGTRPETTLTLFDYLQKSLPSLGIVLDCCTKISHDLGLRDHFFTMFEEMKNFLLANGVQEVLVACPSCHKIFRQYGEPLRVRTVYEVLAEGASLNGAPFSGVVTVHDPCGVRDQESVPEAVRRLIQDMGLLLEEMPHRGSKTVCCGEGGSVRHQSPYLSERWSDIRKAEAADRRIITYCAGCVGFLNPKTPASHVLDVIFDPVSTMAGKTRVSKAPFTYWNRMRLKKRFKETIPAAVTRERTITGMKRAQKSGRMKRLAVLVGIFSAVLAVRATGATRYLDQDLLRGLLEGYGALAPLVYMAVYAVAPVLFLPGLPLTIVGGILFGPFWGIVYAIISATIGACMAFVVSRYLARDWIESKLTNPRWRRLDEAVEKHGWKVVAFTRLIPAFPFNLLNYAFGLTKIKFWHYAVTSFVCMLPGCAAYIIFSSSLLDVIQGRISPGFILGGLLVVVVSLIPYFYKHFSARKGLDDPLE